MKGGKGFKVLEGHLGDVEFSLELIAINQEGKTTVIDV